MQITRDTLENAQYREYPSGRGSVWQKLVRGEDGSKLYFLVFTFTNLFGFGEEVSARTVFFRTDAISAKGETRILMEVRVSSQATLAQVEAFFANAYVALGCVPDLFNND